MKRDVAIVSDVVMKYGGAEKVLDSFLEMYPNSTLYTLFITPGARANISAKFPQVKIVTSIFGLIVRSDYVSKYISIIKILSWVYWERLDLSKFDLVISSSHSYMSKNVHIKPGVFHLAYIHTPPRYLYDEYNEIDLIRRFPTNIIFWPILNFLRFIDKNGASRPSVLVANSKNVVARIEKYYQRQAKLVYPPVDETYVSKNVMRMDYFVCASRLVKQKGIDLAVRACQEMGVPLKVIGDGDERSSLEKISKGSAKFVGNCSDREKYKIIGRARALIYTSIDEDMGIVPIEALKLDIPVIAYNSGGVREVVKDGKTGVFFDDFTVKSLSAAINKFNKLKIGRLVCRKSVRKFGKVKFKEKINKIIKEYDQ